MVKHSTTLKVVVLLLLACRFAHAGDPPQNPRLAYLLDKLQSDDIDTRVVALHGLIAVHYETEPRVVPVVVGLLKDKHPRVRASAASALAWARHAEPSIVRSLEELLDDKSAPVRVAAAGAIWVQTRKRDKLVDVLRPLLDAANPTVRLEAGNLLWQMGVPSDRLVQVFVDVFEAQDRWTRVRAIQYLGQMGPEARDAAPALARLFRDDLAPRVRSVAIDALRRIGPEAKAAIPILVPLLGDARTYWGTTTVGEEAASTLARMGPRGVGLLLDGLARDAAKAPHILGGLGWEVVNSDNIAPAVIIPFVSSDDMRTRAYALNVLGLCGDDPSAVLALTNALWHSDDDTRSHAARVLGAMGPAAKDAVPDLVTLLASKDPIDRVDAAYALGKIGAHPELVIPALAKSLGDFKGDVSEGAAWALRQFGPEAKTATPQLIGTVLAGADQHAIAAAETLGSLGPLAKEAAPALLEVVDKLPICHSLAQIAPQDQPVLAAILAKTKTRKRGHRGDAYRALSGLGSNHPKVIAMLQEALDDEEVDVRGHASMGLLRANPDDRQALNVLGDCLNDIYFMGWPRLDRLSEVQKLLQRLGPNVRPIIPQLIEAVRNDSTLIDINPIVAACGPYAHDTLPDLVKWLVRRQRFPSPDDGVIEAIASVSQESVPELTRLLDDDHAAVRQAAAHALAKLGPRAKSAVPRLVETFKDPRVSVRAAAAEAVGKIRAEDAEAVDGLRELLVDEFLTVRAAAASSLGQIGGPAVLDDVRGTLDDEYKSVRDAAAEAIKLIEGRDK